MRRIVFLFILIFISIFNSFGMGQLETSKMFSSHMVLQRDQPNKIWGEAKANGEVVIEFIGKKYNVVADNLALEVLNQKEVSKQ